MLFASVASSIGSCAWPLAAIVRARVSAEARNVKRNRFRDVMTFSGIFICDLRRQSIVPLLRGSRGRNYSKNQRPRDESPRRNGSVMPAKLMAAQPWADRRHPQPETLDR